MKTLIGMVGLPYSGKTTLALTMKHPIVSPDAIRLALHGHRFIPEAEGMVWSIAKIMVRALFAAGHDTVIVDATNVTAKRRDEWDDDAWKINWVVCDPGRDECLKRATEAGDLEILPIIERMGLAWDVPENLDDA